MSELFVMPRQLPDPIGSIPQFSATIKNRNFSTRDINSKSYFDQKLKYLAKVFGLRSKPQDMGSMFLIEDKKSQLEVYKTSDSFWWTNKAHAYSEKSVPEEILPDDITAVEVASDTLTKMQISIENAVLGQVNHTELLTISKPVQAFRKGRTAVHVNYTFELDGLPVFGPGAKMQLSFVSKEKMSEFVYFWREIRADEEKVELISPEKALDKLMADKRFSKLSKENASVQFHRINLGYYALPPFDYQKSLIPVFQVKGTVRTSNLEKYEFTHYVLAGDWTVEQIKQAGIVADPTACCIY